MAVEQSIRKSTIDEVERLTGKRPYEIQLLCHVMVRAIQRGHAKGLSLSVDVLDEVLAELSQAQDMSERPTLLALCGLRAEELQLAESLAFRLAPPIDPVASRHRGRRLMPRKWRGAVVVRGRRLAMRVKLPNGRWTERTTGYRVGEEEKAKRKLATVRAELQEQAANPAVQFPYVRDWAVAWLEQRAADGAADMVTLSGHVRLHILPAIGAMRMEDVQPRHLVELVDRIRAKGRAPRTIRNVYSKGKAMWRDGRIMGVVTSDPFILTHRQLGSIRDKFADWRHQAEFRRPEFVELLLNAQLPEDHRVANALCGVGMLRSGELAGIRWLHFDVDEKPLARLRIVTSYGRGRTKTNRERWMPVHPVLLEILLEWRDHGWERVFGRPPRPDDLILPVVPETRKGRRRAVGSMRDRHYAWKRLQQDLAVLGFRHRRVHDLRRAGISFARSDGARKANLRRGTHAPPTDVMAHLHVLRVGGALPRSHEVETAVKRGRRASLVAFVEGSPMIATDVLTDDEIDAFVAADGSLAPLHRVVTGLLLLAGPREVEVATLRMQDVDLLAAPLTKIVWAASKMVGLRCEVPVHPELAWSLYRWCEQDWRSYAGRAPTPRDPVVPAVAGVSVSWTIRRLLEETLRHCGIRARSLAVARATFADLLKRGGAPDRMIACLTGRTLVSGISVRTAAESWSA